MVKSTPNMPELPEVEVVVRSLRDFLRGQKISAIEVRRDKSFPQALALAEKTIVNVPIADVIRRAKFIDLVFANDWHLLTHLKMTGQLIYRKNDGNMVGGGHPTADWLSQLPGSHTRIVYQLDQGQLFFNDQRVFGWMKILTSEQMGSEYYGKLGPDANTAGFDAQYLARQLVKKRIPIKQALMDNVIVCGLGNIYAAETLFAAGVSPLRPSNEVELSELIRIVEQAKRILAESIAAGGTTFDGKYVDGQGHAGNFSQQLSVYGRDGEKCQVCQTELVGIRQAGRATVYCPKCQK